MLEWLQEQRKEWQSPRDAYLDAAIDVIATDMRLAMSLIPPSAGVEFAMAMVGKSSEEVRLALLEHSFSSTQVNVPEPLRTELLAFPLDGERELDPHVTVKYGLWTQDVSEVAAVIKNQEPIHIVLGLVNVFTGDDADVVKIDVDSPDLHRLNALLSMMPHTDTYPDYKPHMTLGYVASGTGQQYAGNSQFIGREFTADAIVFSSKDDHVTVIPLNERRMLPRAARRATETSVHVAADSHVPSIKSLFTKAFAVGAAKVKVARTSSPTVVIKLMESAIHASADYLKTRLPDVLLACATDGGNAALGMLPKKSSTLAQLESRLARASDVTECINLRSAINRELAVKNEAELEQSYITAQLVELESLLAQIPKNDYVGRISITARRDSLRALAPKKKMGQVDIEFDDENPDAVAWAKQHAAELITNISETTRERIKDEVVGAFKEGVSPKDLADALDAIVNDEDRAELIARTETMTAANEGQRQAWDQAVDKGLLTGDEKREWIATGDKDTCDQCSELDGTVIGMDDEYPNDGGDGPPAHVFCRCSEGIVG